MERKEREKEKKGEKEGTKKGGGRKRIIQEQNSHISELIEVVWGRSGLRNAEGMFIRTVPVCGHKLQYEGWKLVIYYLLTSY